MTNATETITAASPRDITETAMAFAKIANDAERKLRDDPAALALAEEMVDLDNRLWLDLGDVPSRAMLAGEITTDLANVLHRIHTDYRTGATLGERYAFMIAMRDISRDLGI